MTRDEFIPRLESYLDEYEGTTPLPESVRMAVRAELPKTKQVRSLGGLARYTTMFTTRTAQVALGLAAAALVVAIGTFISSGRNLGGPDDGSVSPSAATSAEPSAAAGCEATTVRATGLGGDTMDVVWCAYGLGEPPIAFTMQGDFRIREEGVIPGAGTLWLRPEGGGAITFALYEDQSADALAADISAREGYEAVGPESTSLGGEPAVTLDISLAEGAASGDVAPLIEDPDQAWRLQEGTFTRVWIVDYNGDALMLAAGQELADAVAAAVGTLAWTD